MRVLEIIDLALAALAGLICLVALVRRPAPGPAEPLRSLGGTPWSGEVIALPILVYFTAYLLLSGVPGETREPSAGLRAMIIGASAQIAGAIACLVLAAGRMAGGWRGFLLGTGSAWKKATFMRIAAVTVVAIGACPVVLWATITVLRPWFPKLETEVHPTLELLRAGQLPIEQVVMLWAGAVIIAPVAEELFFRGIVQNVLQAQTRSPWTAIAGASAAFAFVHLGQPATIPAIIALSFLLGWLYERTGALLAPMLVHALFNARTMLWETLAHG